jgi:hypothetical protein
MTEEVTNYIRDFHKRLIQIQDEADIERFAIDYDMHKFEVHELISNLNQGEKTE